jgi:hypothetical protein
VKIARIEIGRETRIGIVEGAPEEAIVQPLAAAANLDELLAATPAERAHLVRRTGEGQRRPLQDVRLLAPVQPPTLRDYITFEEHLEGGLKGLGLPVHPAWYEQPVFYFTNTNAVIGKPGKDLTPAQAAEHIAGYTLFNDWSARDLMGPVMPIGLGPVKGKDFANTLGPWIVTADELAPYRRGDRLHLEMHAELNGVPLPAGGDTLANMAWSFEEMVAYASRGAQLRTGDVLASGTCGAGCLLEYWGQTGSDQPRSLQPGDTVTLVVEGIGSLSNPVVAGVEPVDIPRARVGQQRRPRPWHATATT